MSPLPGEVRAHLTAALVEVCGDWEPDQGREVAHSGLLGLLPCLMLGGIEWWDFRLRWVLYSGAGKKGVFPWW